MKPVEIFLRVGKERRQRRMEGVNLSKIHCKHMYIYIHIYISTYVNVIVLLTVQLLYANKKDIRMMEASQKRGCGNLEHDAGDLKLKSQY
jgi:hypothetical protein